MRAEVVSNHLQPTDMTLIDHDIELYSSALIHLLEFEALWARYELSDGGLQRDMTRRSAMLLSHSLRKLAKVDEKYSLLLGREAGRSFDLDEILDQLEEWAESKERWPAFYNARDVEGGYQMYEFLSEASVLLKNEFGVVHASRFNPDQVNYRQRRLLWSRHLGRQALDRLNAETTKQLSASETIVVAGDIRRSQELMLYTVSPSEFRERLSAFFRMIRREIFSLDGILDRFTGDGFIAYFNPAVASGETSQDELFSRMITFCRRVSTQAHKHFQAWLPHVRKVPAGGYGFTLGADFGHVSFDDSQNDFLCMGEPIVWATRLCDAGDAGEVMVNNRLRYLLERTGSVNFDARDCRSKNGESFVGHILNDVILKGDLGPVGDD